MAGIPIYAPGAEDFSGNGMGLLLPTECTISEVVNGLYELTLTHPITSDLRWSLITAGCIVKAPAPVRESPLYEAEAATIQGTQAVTVTRKIYKVSTVGVRLNLRKGPGTSHKVIHAYRPGTEVVLLEEQGDWRKVSIVEGGAVGWMIKNGLTFDREVSETITAAAPSVTRPAVRVLPARDQLFRIYSVETDTGNLTVTANALQIFYDLRGNVVGGDYAPENVEVSQAANHIISSAINPHDFQIHTPGLNGKVSGDYGYKSVVEVLLDPDDGLAAQSHALIVRDNYDIFLLPDMARDMGVTIRRGKNLVGVTVDHDESNIVTRIIPVGVDRREEEEKPLFLEGNVYVDSPRIGDYPVIYTRRIEYDVSLEKEDEKDIDNESRFVSAEKARARLKALAEADFAAGCDLPDYGMEVDFILLENTEECSRYAGLQSVHLFDTVTIIDDLIHLSAKVRVTGYEWNAITHQYNKITLGDVQDLSQTVYSYNLPTGGISGSKIATNSMSGNVMRDATIGYAKINTAAITQLSADAITAIRATINQLAAGEITTDQLYADLAKIALAQITTANIDRANIDWAQITNLSAEIANMVNASIGTADIDYARIKDMVTDTAIITEGVGGKLYIARLAVTEANMVSLSVGELMVKAADGSFKRITVDENGAVTAQTVTVEGDNVADATLPGGKLIENTITARELNVQQIFADRALIGAIKAANIDVANLFAAQATISELNSYLLKASTIEALKGALNIWASDKIDLAVGGIKVGGTNLIRTADGMVAVSTGSVNRNYDRTKYYGKSGIQVIMRAFSGAHNLVAYNSGVYVTPGAYTLSFWCWKYGISTQPVIRPNLFYSNPYVDQYFDEFAFKPRDSAPERFEITLNVNYTGKVNVRFVSMTPWTSGEVYITDVKLEKGSMATDWSPSPEDAARGLNTGESGVRVMITDKTFDVDVPDKYGDFHLGPDGARMHTMTAQSVSAPDVARRYDGAATVRIKPNATNAEISGGMVYRSLKDLFAKVNGCVLEKDLTIYMDGDDYGTVNLLRVAGGIIRISGQDHTLNGTMTVMDFGGRLIVDKLKIINSTGASQAAVVYGGGWTQWTNCVFNGGGAARALMFAQGARTSLISCEVYNATTLLSVEVNADVTATNLKGGGGTNFATFQGCTARFWGTRPDGTKVIYAPSLLAPADPSTCPVDSGSAQPSVPVVQTGSWGLTSGDTYGNSWSFGSHDDLVQGWTSGGGRLKGCMWFDNGAIRTALSGKTVKSATLRLTMWKGVGRGVGVTVELCGTALNASGHTGSEPAVTKSYGVIGTTQPGETATMTIPVQAVNDLKSGAINGLMLYSSDTEGYKGRVYSKNYARFDGATSGTSATKPVITVVYQ